MWLIDVSQSVEPTHPHGLEFLFRDCRNVSTVHRRTPPAFSTVCTLDYFTVSLLLSLQFFQKRGVSEAMSTYDLFNTVTGLNIPVGAEDEFLAEVMLWTKLHSGPSRAEVAAAASSR